MITAKKAANAVGGKTARACDGCLRKRARWYCPADDAFLCQVCDSSVHSANQLASRHGRVRLEKASSKAAIENSPPAWHRGITRKARTPRHTKPASLVQRPKEKKMIKSHLPLVPEIGNEEASLDEDEEQLLYRVPVFDPFSAEFYDVSNEVGNKLADERAETAMGGGLNVLLTSNGHDEACDLDNFHGFLPSDMDLAEFAADVESLLGTGLDEDSCGIEGLGLLDCKEEDAMETCLAGGRKVKVEDEDEDVEAVVAFQLDTAMELTRETIDWNFDYESPVTGKEEKAVAAVETAIMNDEYKAEVERKIFLRLNYEGVVTAWASQGSPWTTGSRPEFNPNDCWPDFMGSCPTGSSHPCVGVGGHVRCGEGGREARVSRYREKRRTRLFSKKIRYEVRKLNAEKRPRMKGRFVKRASFAGPAAAFPYLIKK